MLAARLAKAIMAAAVAAFALLVAYDNVVDYDTNFVFVQHVMAMDTTPAGGLMARAVTAPAAWRAGYAAIIVGEAVTGVLFAAGSIALLRRMRAPAAAFERAKVWVALGGLAGVLVWFFGFMVVGGEWFQMWRSPSWNGQQAAFRFVMVILAVVLYVQQREWDVVKEAHPPCK